MPINITARNYSTRNYSGGNSFLLANSGQIVTEKTTLVIDFNVLVTASNQIQFVAENSIRLLSGASWFDFGVVVGDTLTLAGFRGVGYSPPTAISGGYVVASIVGDTLTFTTNVSGGALTGTVFPQTVGSENNFLTITSNRTAPEAVDIYHNLIDNGANNGLGSIIDGEVNRFVGVGVNAMAVNDTINLSQIGNKSGGTYTLATLKRIADVSGSRCFELTFSYAMPKITDSDFDTPSVLLGNLSLKPFIRFQALPEENNPNSNLLITDSVYLGNVGWYNESYNQGLNPYTIASVVYQDLSGNNLQTVDYAQTTRVTATITGGSFDQKAEIEFYIIPDDFKNKPQSNGALIHLANSYVTTTASNTALGDVTFDNVTAVTSTGQIVLTFDIVPNADFTTLIENTPTQDRRFRISGTVQLSGGDANNNKAVSLILGQGLLEKAPIQGGEFDGVTDTLLDHNNDELGGGDCECVCCVPIVIDGKLEGTATLNEGDNRWEFTKEEFNVHIYLSSENERWEMWTADGFSLLATATGSSDDCPNFDWTIVGDWASSFSTEKTEGDGCECACIKITYQLVGEEPGTEIGIAGEIVNGKNVFIVGDVLIIWSGFEWVVTPDDSISVVWATLSEDTPCPFGTFTIEEGSIFESFVVEPCSSCECEPIICTEDDFLYSGVITLEKNKQYQSLELSVVIENTQEFEIFSRTINFNNYVTTPNGVINVNYNEPLSQFLTSPNRNQIRVVNNGTTTSTTYEVSIIWSLMANWRYWLPQSNALVDFFNSTLPQNGQSQEWMRYIRESGWNIKLRFNLIDDQNTVFFWEKPFNLQDYDASPVISSNIELFDANDVPMTALLSGQTMKVRVTHTTTSTFSQSNEWAWISVRPFESETNRRISTAWAYNSISLPLKEPLSMTFPNPTTCVVEALIDVNQLSGTKATIVTRINDGDAKEVHKQDFEIVQLPKDAIREDRGVKFCGEPQLVLFSLQDAAYYKNDRTGLAYKFDDMTVELEATDGTLTNAPGINVNFPNQSDAVGFVIDWRQVGVSGCYKVKISWTKSGVSGWFYFGSFRLLPYSVENALGTVRLFVVLNDLVRKQGINYKDSGFATTIRFSGTFGYMQPKYETENIIYGNRVRNKVRQEALRTYELRTNYLLSCMTRQIDEEILLTANQIYVTDHNANNHVQDYYDFPVIISEEESPQFEYTNSVYAKMTAVFLDKVAVHESKYDGNIQGSENVILELPTVTSDGGGLINVSNSNGTYDVDTSTDLVLPDTNVNVYVDGVLSGTGTIVTLDNSEEINILWT